MTAAEPLVPVTVMVYVPVGVPPPPPPLLPLPQAGRRSKAAINSPSIRNPKNFLRGDPQDPKLAPRSVIPSGSSVA